jgi:hypothetical protein
MQLPFSIADRLPARDDLRHPRTWALAGIAICIVAASVAAIGSRWPRTTGAPAAEATLAIISDPPGAIVLVGGKDRGRTPATLALPAGEARVTLRLADHCRGYFLHP